MNADGSNALPLINDANRRGMYSSPKWSPDGTKIVTTFQLETRNSIDAPREIIVMNADGSNQINISNRGKYYFNSGQSAFFDVDADWQPLVEPPNFAASVIGFNAPYYTVHDGAGSLPITIRRKGNLNDVASCFYVTLETTTMIKHYDPSATGMLRFAAGESSKTISISNGGRGSWKMILSDNEGNATFIGGIKEATMTILDKDSSPPTKNPS
jgi:hypothetical protein